MGNYSVPESIRNLKPKGTMVKKIHGRYYMYEYVCRKDEDGKWKSIMGKQIGSITDELGFIPNNSFNVDDETTTLEYGQYDLVIFNSNTILDDLMAVFNPADACHIYLTAQIHFVNSFVRLKDVEEYYNQSWMSKKYPDAKMGCKSLFALLDSLGRKQTRVKQFEQKLVENHRRSLPLTVMSCGLRQTVTTLRILGINTCS